MRSNQIVNRLASILLAAPVLVAGCGHNASPSTAAVHSAISGKVYGGQQPITGATLQIYTEEQGTNGGMSTSLISATLTSSDGSAR